MKYILLKNRLLYSCFAALPLLCPAGAYAGNDVEWATHLGGSLSDTLEKMTMDGAGNVYTCGSFGGRVDFEFGVEIEVTSEFEASAFVMKQDRNGDFLWGWNLGGNAHATALAVDDEDNVYIAGVYRGTLDFDPGAGEFNLVAPGAGDSTGMFLSKLDSEGNFAWAISTGFAVRGFALANDIAIDRVTGSTHVVGTFYGELDFDPSTGEFFMTGPPNDKECMYVLSISSSGEFEGAVKPRASTLGQAISAAPGGGAYIVGRYLGSTLFPQGPDAQNGYLVHLKPDGEFGWSRQFIGEEGLLLSDVAVNNFGKIFVSGYYGATLKTSTDSTAIDFEALLNSESEMSRFLVSFDEEDPLREGDESLQWARTLEGAVKGDFEYFPLDVDGQGNLYMAGRFWGQTDLDPGEGLSLFTPTSGMDSYVAKLSANGDLIWARQFFGSHLEVCVSVAVGNLGSVYTAGYFFEQMDLDAEGDAANFTTRGYLDCFVAKLRVPTLVKSISRMASTPTNSDTVAFYVVFGDAVSGVTAEDFLAVTDGFSGATVVSVTGGPNAYVVEVAVESGDGTVGLSLVDDDSILDSSLIPLGGVGEGNGDFTSTEFYEVDLVSPEFGDLTVLPNEASQDEVVTITFTPSEALEGEPSVAVNGNAATRVSDETFTYTYLVRPTDGITAATITITGTDLVGNVGSRKDTSLLTIVDMPVEGEGGVEGEGEGEGIFEGSTDGEGSVDGEGAAEGEGAEEGEPADFHTADLNGDLNIDLSELLRVFQLHTAGRLHCANAPSETEDGFVPGFGTNISCAPHDSDYAPQDWAISLSEVLRTIQIHNQGAYAPCDSAEDGFCL